MGAYKTKSRSYRRRTQKRETNKRLTKKRRKSFRKIRKQKAGNANLITAAAALASTAALGAGFYYIKPKKDLDYEKMYRRHPGKEDPYGIRASGV
jgi:uncharacterized protein HemX